MLAERERLQLRSQLMQAKMQMQNELSLKLLLESGLEMAQLLPL